MTAKVPGQSHPDLRVTLAEGRLRLSSPSSWGKPVVTLTPQLEDRWMEGGAGSLLSSRDPLSGISLGFLNTFFTAVPFIK